MATEYEASGNSGDKIAGFVVGLLAGACVGAGLGMLFAPKRGADVRNDLANQADALANTAADGYRRATESAGEWVDRGKQMYDQTKAAVAAGVTEAKKSVRNAKTATNNTVEASGATVSRMDDHVSAPHHTDDVDPRYAG